MGSVPCGEDTALEAQGVALLARPDASSAELLALAQQALARERPELAARLAEHASRSPAHRVAALCLLGLASWQTGNTAGGQAHIDEALRLDPACAPAWYQRGELLAACFDLPGAADAYARAAALLPKDFAAHYQLGRCYVQLNRYHEARGPLEQAVALLPQHLQANTLYAAVLGQIGETERAVAIHTTLAKNQPRNWNAQIASRLLLPDIYQSKEDLLACRSRYAQGLSALQELAENYQPARGERFEVLHANFALAYQGENDLPLQCAWARVLETLANKLAPELCAPLPPRIPRKKLRVGFVSSMLRAHTVGNYFGPWLKSLDRERFEVRYYNLYRGSDATIEELSRASSLVRRLTSSPQAAAEALREDELDALIFTDVGMDYTVSILPAFRLAPLQIAAWGHPVTTGFANIDMYLSCRDMEPAHYREHYCESVSLLPGIGTFYPLPETPAPASREAFGLPQDRPLYLNPQSLFKIHPDNDELICDLMEQDPRGIVLFFQDGVPAKTRAFAARLSRAMQARGLPPRGQIKFLPRTDTQGFRALIQMADVMLDTLHWSGGNTSLDALAVGLPLVTLPGQFMRGRQSSAMLRAMGLAELIVASREEYVARALQLGRDAVYRNAVRQCILARRPELFARSEAISALAELLEASCRATPPAAGALQIAPR